MLNQYHYIDPDYTYTDPETGVLRNLEDPWECGTISRTDSRNRYI